MKILVVEDNKGDQRIMKEIFKQHSPSTELTLAEDADQAMAHFKKGKKERNGFMPHFVILDLNLPKRSGKDFLRDMKADPLLKKIPVLILTSSDAETDIEEC